MFDCSRSTEQWKVTQGSSRSEVLGHNTGIQWSFYDTRSCTHIEVIGHDGHYREEWISEVSNPAQLRPGAIEFGVYAAYYD